MVDQTPYTKIDDALAGCYTAQIEMGKDPKADNQNDRATFIKAQEESFLLSVSKLIINWQGRWT